MTLWHRTCDHGRAGIGREGWLRPNPHPLLDGAPLVWLTDSRAADRMALGLTSETLSCDRTRFLYQAVKAPAAMPWLTSPWRKGADPEIVADLESLGEPARWWVSALPVRARLVGIGGAA